MVINLTFSLFILMFAYVNLLVSIFIIGVMTFIVLLIIKGLRHPENFGFWAEYYGKTISATNVFVKIPAKKLPEDKAGNIIISAHLDSKSQTFKTSWRVVFYRVWLYSGIFLGGFLITLIIRTYTLIKLDIIIVGIGVWVFTIMVSISNLFLLFLNTHNRSPGALDNASGMAIIFELSSYFKDHHLDNFNVWLCQFSAEELGTMGSRVFVNKYEDHFIKGRVFQFNMDMISAAGLGKNNRIEYLKSYGVLPRKKIAPLLSKYMDQAAQDENIIIKGYHLTTGAHLDSVPFHLRGFDAIDINTRWAARWTHNREDTPEKVDSKVLLDTCTIVRKVVAMLDNDYKILCKNEELLCEV